MAAGKMHNGELKLHQPHIPEIKFTKMFINGQFVHSVQGRTFESNDPITEEVIARIAKGDKEDVDLAVKAARQAFDERSRIMMRFVDLIEENVVELAALDTSDAGKLFSRVGSLKDKVLP